MIQADVDRARVVPLLLLLREERRRRRLSRSPPPRRQPTTSRSCSGGEIRGVGYRFVPETPTMATGARERAGARR